MKRITTIQNQHPLKQMKKSTSFSGISQNSEDTSEIFYNTILKCPICESKVRNAHMCPSCCKLFCQGCIKNWVVKNPECPNCARNLRLISIVNCQHLGKQIEEAISKKQSNKLSGLSGSFIQTSSGSNENRVQSLTESSVTMPDFFSPSKSMTLQRNNTSPQKQCFEHQLKLDYYCEECKKGICSDCAVLTDKHRGHKLCKLSVKSRILKDQVVMISQKIHDYKILVARLRQAELDMKNKLKSIEVEKINYFFNYIKKMEDMIMIRLNQQIVASETLLLEVKDSHQESAKKYTEIEQQVQKSYKGNLISIADTLEQQISRLISDFTIKRIPRVSEAQQMVVPKFYQKNFVFNNYTILKNRNEIILSEPFYLQGVQWRIKLYPNGLETTNYSYSEPSLAVYIEMVKSHIQNVMYTSQIDIINHVDPNKKLTRVLESYFEEGLAWGYDSFAKISQLYEQKYIHPIKDQLHMTLNIRYTSYFSALKAKNIEINQRYQKIDRNIETLEKLRSKLDQTAINKSAQSIDFIDETKSTTQGLSRNHSYSLMDNKGRNFWH